MNADGQHGAGSPNSDYAGTPGWQRTAALLAAEQARAAGRGRN